MVTAMECIRGRHRRRQRKAQRTAQRETRREAQRAQKQRGGGGGAEVKKAQETGRVEEVGGGGGSDGMADSMGEQERNDEEGRWASCHTSSSRTLSPSSRSSPLSSSPPLSRPSSSSSSSFSSSCCIDPRSLSSDERVSRFTHYPLETSLVHLLCLPSDDDSIPGVLDARGYACQRIAGLAAASTANKDLFGRMGAYYI